METDPPEQTARAELERVRERLTSLVERRLAFGLTEDEEAEYRRLTEIERELLRKVQRTGEEGGEEGTTSET